MKLFNMFITAYRNADRRNSSEETLRSDIQLKIVASVLMCIAALVLTVFNLVNYYWLMMYSTIVLAVGFGICAVLLTLFRKRRNSILIVRRIVIIIIMLLCGATFTMYALIGGNDGFAILWMLLVPMIGTILIGLRAGTIISAYFQIFVIILFYTPLKYVFELEQYYNDTFMNRFPVLFLTCFAASVILAVQKEFYYQKTETMAYIDVLTGLNNRRHYEAVKADMEDSGDTRDAVIIFADVNRLKYTNDVYGHEAGDEIIIAAARCIERVFLGSDAICRIGGDEFAVITRGDSKTISERIKSLQKIVSEWKGEIAPELTLSIGMACKASFPFKTLRELEANADKMMYDAKNEYYTANNIDRRKS